jgi:uncharacterized protein YnzC (UPF0291/DUF896 family)
MITKEMIERINMLSQKQRLSGLNEEEKLEQSLLRRQYLDNIKEQVRGQLDAAQVPKKHSTDCNCGCHCEPKH